MLVLFYLHVHLSLIFKQIGLVVILYFATTCWWFGVPVIVVRLDWLFCLSVLAHTLLLQSLIEIHPVDQVCCLVTNIWYELVLPRVNGLLGLKMIDLISWAVCELCLSHFSLLLNLFIFFEESFWLFDQFFVLLLLSRELCLYFRLPLRLTSTWAHWAGWHTRSSWGCLLHTKVSVCITPRGCHTADWSSDWPRILCPSRLRSNFRALSEVLSFYNNLFGWFLITNLIVKAVDEIDLVLLSFR